MCDIKRADTILKNSACSTINTEDLGLILDPKNQLLLNRLSKQRIENDDLFKKHQLEIIYA